MKHNNKMESLKDCEDTAVKQEFKYPMWFKNKHYDIIVKFDKLNQWEVVKSNDKEFPIGLINRLSNHINTEI